MSIELINGECIAKMAKIPTCSIDAVICDPPYGTTGCKWDSIIPLDLMWKQLKRIIKPKGAIVLCGSQPFTTQLISSNYDMFKYCWGMGKPQGVNPFMSKIRPLNNIEDIMVFCKTTPMYNPQLVGGKPYTISRDKNPRINQIVNTEMKSTTTVNTGSRLPTRIIKVKQERGLHPTQKPVELMEYLIKTYTNENETVLDFTMGSGSTGYACLNSNRNFIGIELDPDYFELAKDRLTNHVKSDTMRSNGLLQYT